MKMYTKTSKPLRAVRAIVVIAAIGLSSAAAQAATFTAVIKGTLTEGFDYSGVFVPGGGTLVGQEAEFTLFGDTDFATSITSTANGSITTSFTSGSGNPQLLSTKIEINGASVTLGSSYNELFRKTNSSTGYSELYYRSETAGGRAILQALGTGNPLIDTDLGSSLALAAGPGMSMDLSFYIFNLSPRTHAEGRFSPSSITFQGATSVPGPIAGAGIPALLALGGFAWARRRSAIAASA